MSLLRRIVSSLRTAWLIVGISLLLLVVLEGLYLGQAGLRRLVRGPDSEGPRHPNADQPWWPDWVARRFAVNGPSVYDPYRGWWAAPYHSKWVQVDSAGHRRTVPSPSKSGGPRIAFLGGSVMWGYTVPDSLTIPSMVARQLHERGLASAEVVNLAQPSYNLTQGMITLLLSLRNGQRYDAVVSLDGNNDVLALLNDGHAGAAVGEADLARRSAVGWRGFWPNVAGLVRYSELFNRIGKMVGPSRTGQAGTGDHPTCDTIAAYYTNLVATGEVLGRENHFMALFLWQPHWATTHKKLTPFEAELTARAGFPELVRACTNQVDSLMSARRDSAFISLSGLYDQDSSDIFLDEFGHLTPRGNAIIADQVVRRLLPQLGAH